MPAEYLSKLSYEQRTQLWTQQIADKTKYVLVAENELGDIIGFTSASKRDSNPTPHSNYVDTLYLLEEYQGKGIGKQLLKEIFHYFHQKIYQTIFVEILAENKTRYFYEYYGAELIKSLEITIGGKVLEELVYEWKDIEEAIEKLV